MMKKSVSGSSKIRKIFAIAGICLIGIALVQLAKITIEPEIGNHSYEQLEQEAVIRQTGEKTDSVKIEDTEESFDYHSVWIDFDLLHQTNEDIAGWILFDENGISYPIVQGKDNEEYLYQTADKTKNPAGSIFLDSLCSADFQDSHTIIYGHNMKDESMFGKLKNYHLKEDYYQKNRYFTIYTPKHMFRYEIFAWYEVSEDDSVYQVGFSPDNEFGSFVEQMLSRRYSNTEVSANKWDHIVTLSTCAAKGKRFVVHAKQFKT